MAASSAARRAWFGSQGYPGSGEHSPQPAGPSSSHLGAVYLAEAGGRAVAIRETDKLSGAFATRAEVAAVAADLETWSLLAFEHFESREADGTERAAREPSSAPMR